MTRLLHLKAAIILAGRTCGDVAAAVDVQPVTLSMVICGRQAPWPALLDRLALELGKPADELFPELVSVEGSA